MLTRILLHCFIISFFTLVYCEEQWKIEEKNVCRIAQHDHLPIAVVFLGDDGCPWSQKLSQDVLSDAYFLDRIGNDAVLWTVTAEKGSQDQEIQQKYGIKEYPQVLLLDPKGKEFARFGYLPLNARGYVDEIISLINNFQDVCVALEQKEGVFDEEILIDLYLKSKTLSAPYFKHVILERGLKKEKGNFFHFEKLSHTLEKCKLKNPQVVKLKSELLKRDPENKRGTHYKVALLEFQKFASKFKSKGRPEKAIKPLLRYVHGIGKRDSENLWKAEMAIAEFLFEKKAISSALEHMETAYHASPEAMKPTIAESILYMKKDLL